MGALFLKDLADKTRRGLRGRVEMGRSSGGLCFVYDVVRTADPDDRGEREINPIEAAVVRRIFRDYLAGQSSRAIAMTLDEEGIAGPQGKEWGPSTIHGNPKRGTGDPEQRTLHQTAGLQPAALHEGSRHRQAGVST